MSLFPIATGTVWGGWTARQPGLRQGKAAPPHGVRRGKRAAAPQAVPSRRQPGLGALRPLQKAPRNHNSIEASSIYYCAGSREPLLLAVRQALPIYAPIYAPAWAGPHPSRRSWLVAMPCPRRLRARAVESELHRAGPRYPQVPRPPSERHMRCQPVVLSAKKRWRPPW